MKRSPSFFLSMVIAMTLLICLSPLLYPAAAQVAAEYAEENADEPASPVLPEEEDLPLPSPAPLSFISQSDIDLYESVYIGNKSENVQKAMKRLKDLGYIDNVPSGDIFTYLMTNFVKEFQQVNGILANGLISQETQALLFSDYAIPKEKTESSPEIETEVAQTAELDHSEDPETEYPDFLYTIIDDQAAISGYTGTNNAIDIPEKIEGKPVTSLEVWDVDQPTEILRFSLPLTVASIPEGFFSQFKKIRSITVAEDNPSFSSFNGVLFDKARETLLVYPAGKTPASYRIPNSVISIGALAFSSAHSLTEIIISNRVNYIGKQAFIDCIKLKEMIIPDSVLYIEEDTFTNCISLKSIDVSRGNPVYKAVNGVLIDAEKEVLHTYPNGKEDTSFVIPEGIKTISAKAFWGSRSLGKITFPEGLVSIGDQAFYECKSLLEIMLPNSIVSIGNQSFYGCEQLTSISFPSGISDLGDMAFMGCTGLIDVSMPESLVSIGAGAFADCSSLGSFNLSPRNSAYVLVNGALVSKVDRELVAYPIGKPDSEYSIAAGIIRIGDFAFQRAVNLIRVSMPDSIQFIGNQAFSECTALTGINIPNGVTDIGNGAFSFCGSLASISIPETAVNLGDSIFTGSDLISILGVQGSTVEQYAFTRDIPFVATFSREGVPIGILRESDGSKAVITGFSGALNDLAIPAMLDSLIVTKLGDWAFYWNTVLTRVALPETMNTIGHYAFAGCSELIEVVIPESVVDIANDAFQDCRSDLVIVAPEGSYANLFAVTNGINFRAND